MNKRHTALAVDDHPVITHQLRLWLGGHGIEVIEAQDADEARRQFHARKPDLVIVDWNLAKISGVKLLAELARGAPSRTRFVLFTAFPTAGLIDRAQEAGAHAVCCKSSPREDLLRVFDDCLSGAGWALDPTCTILHRTPQMESSQRESLRHLAAGLTIRETAACTGVSTGTAAAARAELKAQAGLHMPVEIVDAARRHDALPEEKAQALLR